MQENTIINLRHIRCNMDDFFTGRHRFRFYYNGKEYVASCYGGLDVFVDGSLPEDIEYKLQKIIWEKIDKDQYKWRYPKEAYEIADAYCKENFA